MEVTDKVFEFRLIVKAIHREVDFHELIFFGNEIIWSSVEVSTYELIGKQLSWQG
jgi:hypothetical protein